MVVFRIKLYIVIKEHVYYWGVLSFDKYKDTKEVMSFCHFRTPHLIISGHLNTIEALAGYT